MRCRIETPVDEDTPAICRFDADHYHLELLPALMTIKRHYFVTQDLDLKCRCTVTRMDVDAVAGHPINNLHEALDNVRVGLSPAPSIPEMARWLADVACEIES